MIVKPKPKPKPKAIAQPSAAALPWLVAFNSRTDLKPYAEDALGLFALALRFGLEDLDTVAADAITEGGGDKKCDIVFLNPDEGYAVVAQCYVSKTPLGKQAAPANKASDLNTGVSWLLQRDLKDLPEAIRFSAEDLRSLISDGTINHLHVWYIHNLPESKNVRQELKTVESTAAAALHMHHPDKSVTVSALEVGSDTLAEWYHDSQSSILVTDDFVIYVDDGFSVSGKSWKGYVTSIPLQFLRREYKRHELKLFSANVRDYLGSKASDSNINHGIKKTAETQAGDFWVFNNGVTVLVNSFEEPKRMKSGRLKFSFSGLSIVNGAQTTGAIGSLQTAPPNTARVAVRFIQTDDQNVVSDIIRFNNSQNKVTASDFRSTDATQRRLRTEMAEIPEAQYEGGRRGGPTDAIKRRPNLLASYTVGQALAAFHGDATVAYNQKAEIWSSDTLYSRYFGDHTTAAHIVFAYSLLRSIEGKKASLIAKSKTALAEMTTSEEQHLAFLRRRGSTFLLVTAIASCLEIFLQKKIPNLSRVSFTSKISPAQAMALWDKLVETHLPFTMQLQEAFTHGLQNRERVKEAVQKFKSLVEVTASQNAPTYKTFASATTSK